ncbi:MAG: thymidine phosphorylase [Fusobacteriaceae bacterium]|jgi:pyrimidine-nucleoside phosphorylase|nr:thymidine phosphorylase [Fusobacteriaceae bacterium]
MLAIKIIEKKRDKYPLTSDEINFFLNNYLNGNIPDYQMSALLMAIYFNGLNQEELFHFTNSMINSGELIKINNSEKFLIDKHSTGGVGDKTTIALVGLFGCFGIGEIKLSGKSLGHTGGTVDKFESIPNFKFPENKNQMIDMVNKIGSGIMGYSDKIVPLDKKIYALRDVTGTIESISLIASSIMSKKLAITSNGIILDIKVGSGAFMKNIEDAKELSQSMMNIGKNFGRKIVGVLTDMEQPLGFAVGNANEVIEAIETLKGNGPKDFSLLVNTIIGIGLLMAGKAQNIDEGKLLCENMIKTGKPIEHFKKFLEYTGGNPKITEDYSLLPMAKNKLEFKSKKEGYISQIQAENIGRATMIIGAGRSKIEDSIDYGVGINLTKKIGDKVNKGDILAVIQYNDDKNIPDSLRLLEEAYVFSDKKIPERDVIIEIQM